MRFDAVLRRTCARLRHGAGGELEQIQFLLGHASVQMTERYTGCRQKFKEAVNDPKSRSPRPRDNPVYRVKILFLYPGWSSLSWALQRSRSPA